MAFRGLVASTTRTRAVRTFVFQARDAKRAAIREEVKGRLAALVGSKEVYSQQIAEGENMINEGLALVMQGRAGLETIARNLAAGQEFGILISEVDLRIIRERMANLDYFPQAVTSNTFEIMIRKCCPDLNISDRQIGALVAAIDVSGDDLIQIEEFDAFLARTERRKKAARVLVPRPY